MERKAIRDFIYLDEERLKSIIAQTDEGIVDSFLEVTSDSHESSKGLGLKIPFLEGEAGKKYITENQSTHTKTLHDCIYNKVEKIIIDHSLLKSIPGENTPYDERSRLNDTDFVLIRGNIAINSFGNLYSSLQSMFEMADLTGMFSSSGKGKGPSQKRELKKLLDLMKKYVESFHQDSIVIQARPYASNPQIAFAGMLDPTYLREGMTDIIFKYGTKPKTPWQILARICAIPERDGITMEEMLSNILISDGNEKTPVSSEEQLGALFERAFDFTRVIDETFGLSVKYPQISITPIAIYR